MDGTVRFLRNVMGLWLLQESLRDVGASGPARGARPRCCAAAARCRAGGPIIDPDDAGLPAARRHAGADRRRAAEAAGQPPPASRAGDRPLHPRQPRRAPTPGRSTTRPGLSGGDVDVVHSSAAGRATSCSASSPPTPAGCRSSPGPVEATALGNVLVQARAPRRRRRRPGVAARAGPGDPRPTYGRFEPLRRSAARSVGADADARRAVHHLLQRPAVPRRRQGGGAAAAAARRSRSSSRRPDLLRADDSTPATATSACRWCAGSSSAFDGYDAVVDAVGVVRGDGPAPPRDRRETSPATPRWPSAVDEVAPRVYELTEFLVDVLGVTDVGARFPHRVAYHPTCHSLRMLGVGDRPQRLLGAVDGLTPGRPRRRRGVLRVRRHVRGQERRHVGRDGRRQGRGRRGDRRRGARPPADNSCLHAPRRPAVRGSGSPSASCTSPRSWRGGGRERPVAPGVREPTPTFAGTPPFPEAARAALADEPAAAQPRPRDDARSATSGPAPSPSVDDWEELRLAGAAIKDDVLARLAELLDELEAQRHAPRAASSTGPATPPRRTPSSRTSCAGARRDEVVKVKSMATQEIELNEALAREGIAAWETDLAELIVQLGHDLPSHILVPAIHRNRAEIREIFRARDGRGRTAGARRPDRRPAGARPRPRGCTCARSSCGARVAVSGANFAVAETGTVMVVESEGNGRMCLTLPDVLDHGDGHREGACRRWQDLEVFLQLLPRSSTAERMNPYTSMWTGVTPGDGPQAFHLVLLDNGRTGTLVRPGRAAGAALHPVLGLPQRLPGLRADRRPAPTARPTRARSARSSLRSCVASPRHPSTRRPRRCRTRRRCAAPASRSARCGSTSPRSSSTCVPRSSAARLASRRRTRRPCMMGALGWTFGSPRRLGGAERVAGLGGRVVARRRPDRAAAAARVLGRVVPRPRPAGAGARVVPALVAAGRADGDRP